MSMHRSGERRTEVAGGGPGMCRLQPQRGPHRGPGGVHLGQEPPGPAGPRGYSGGGDGDT